MALVILLHESGLWGIERLAPRNNGQVTGVLMDQPSISVIDAVDIFLVLLIGIGPKIALVPYLNITATLYERAKQQVQREMLLTAASAAIVLILLGELLRVLLHFSVAALSVAGGTILLVIAVGMVIGQAHSDEEVGLRKEPLQLARVPLGVPYLLNPIGIVGLVTISAEAESVTTLVLAIAMLGLVLLLDVAVFRWATRMGPRLDEGKMLVTEKVFGFLIAAIAVQLVLDGLSAVGAIAAIAH